MDVIKVIGVLVGIAIIIAIVYGYDNYIVEKYQETIFDMGKVVVLFIAEGMALGSYIFKEDLRSDNFFALLGVAALIVIACTFVNIKIFGIIHGIIITLIQFIAALIILFLILIIFASQSESKKRRHRRGY